MRASIHRPMSFTLGLCLSTFGPLSYAQEREREPEVALLELGSTEILPIASAASPKARARTPPARPAPRRA